MRFGDYYWLENTTNTAKKLIMENFKWSEKVTELMTLNKKTIGKQISQIHNKIIEGVKLAGTGHHYSFTVNACPLERIPLR